jgi:vancomycin permeability regulator SanA
VCVEHGKAGEVLLNEVRIMFPSLIVMGIREGATLCDYAPWPTLAQTIRASCPVLVVRRIL